MKSFTKFWLKKNGNTYTFDKQENFIAGISRPQMKLNSDQNFITPS